MFDEHGTIILTQPVTGDDKTELVPEDVGCIIHVHDGGKAYVVEFMAIDGETIDIATVKPDQIRPAYATDIAHASETSPVT